MIQQINDYLEDGWREGGFGKYRENLAIKIEENGKEGHHIISLLSSLFCWFFVCLFVCFSSYFLFFLSFFFFSFISEKHMQVHSRQLFFFACSSSCSLKDGDWRIHVIQSLVVFLLLLLRHRRRRADKVNNCESWECGWFRGIFLFLLAVVLLVVVAVVVALMRCQSKTQLRHQFTT